MKNKILFLLFLTVSIGYSQKIITNDYELYLNDYEESEVHIAKGMYMTKNKQYFYEGQVEVMDLNTKKINLYQFYFSIWDKGWKEFIVKDAKFLNISPAFTFIDNQTLKYVDKDSGEEKLFKLKDGSTMEQAILSSMLVWLENFKKEKA